MSKTAQLVLKIVAAGLAFAALVCLIVGSWQDMAKGCAAPSTTTITTRSSISKSARNAAKREGTVRKDGPFFAFSAKLPNSGEGGGKEKSLPKAGENTLTDKNIHGKIKRL